MDPFEEPNSKIEKLYKSIPEVLERITDGFYAVDNDFTITYWNKKSEHWLNVKRELALGRNLWKVFPEAVGGLMYEKHHAAIQRQTPQEYEVFWEKSQDWYLINSYPSPNGLSVFFKNITKRKRLEQELENEMKERQRVVTVSVIKAEEDVRSHIGRELHDNVNQILSIVRLHVNMCLKSAEFNEEQLQKAAKYLNTAIEEIRLLSKRLSPPSIGNINLSDSIGELVQELNSTMAINIRYQTEGLTDIAIKQELHTTIYRIVQEHLNNVLKHAEASLVELTISKVSDRIVVTIHDNGKGFDLNQKRTGTGITNMLLRAEALNGKLDFKTSQGNGSLLIADFSMK
jgi:PAS domain S-box-containing protein